MIDSTMIGSFHVFSLAITGIYFANAGLALMRSEPASSRFIGPKYLYAHLELSCQITSHSDGSFIISSKMSSHADNSI